MRARVTTSDLDKIVTILCADSSQLTKIDQLVWRLGLLPSGLVQTNWSFGINNRLNDYLRTCLTNWISIKGERATFENLIQALRKSQLGWVADTVETAFNLNDHLTNNNFTPESPTNNPLLDPIHSLNSWSETVTSAKRESTTLVGSTENSELLLIGKQKEFIQVQISNLVQSTVHLEKLQLNLLAKGLLTENELKVMESKPNNISKLTYLYVHSDLTKKPSFFQHLKEAFEETNNSIPLQILQMFSSKGL